MKRIFIRLPRISPTFLTIVAVSLAIALVNSVSFFQGLLIRPKDTVFLGTIHYYEDYFLYLNHVFQGAHGAWLTVNRYTSEVTPPSIIYWTNILIGKLGTVFGLSPLLAYNISVIFLSFATLLSSYLLLRLFSRDNPKHALIAFLFAAFSTSFMNRIIINNHVVWYPFQLWRTPHYAFDRLGGAPHQIFQTLFFLLLAWACFSSSSDTGKKNILRVFSFLLAGLLTTINPVQGVMFLCLWFMSTMLSVGLAAISEKNKQLSFVAAVMNKVDWIKLLLVMFSVVFAFVYTYRIMDTLPHLQSKIWEASQHTFTDFFFLVRSIGPIAFFSVIGVMPLFRRKTAESFFSILLLISGYGLFLSPVPARMGISNLRIIFPAMATFLGILATHGIIWLSNKVSSIMHVRQHSIETIFVVLFLIVSLPTIAFEVSQKLLETSDTSSPIHYLPNDIYEGFIKLESMGKFDDVALANSVSRMDVLIPALSGHTTYSGHMLATIDSAGKSRDAGDFFSRTIPSKQALVWLHNRNIRYVLFTRYDGQLTNITSAYPFLITRFNNNATTVFEVPDTVSK